MKNVKTRKLNTRIKKFILMGGLMSTILFLSGCMRFDTETGAPQGFLSELVYDFLIVPLDSVLDMFADFLGSYGWAIILFTILFRLILLPLTLRQQKGMIESQVKMGAVQPVATEIQEEIQNSGDEQEKQALSMELMELYRDNNISMTGQLSSGCLPLLLQMPIFVAMLQVLRQSEAINQATFLGINLGETSIILGVVTALIYLVQMRLSMANLPEQQRQATGATMYITPVMMGFLAISGPAGIALYWMMSGLFGMGQQFFINNFYRPKIKAQVKEKMGDVEVVERKRKPTPNKTINQTTPKQNKNRNKNKNRNAGKQQRNRNAGKQQQQKRDN